MVLANEDEDWMRRGEGSTLAASRSSSGADYCFYNPHRERAFYADDAWKLATGPRALPLAVVQSVGT